MKTALTLSVLSLLVSSSAFAYKDGTYNCRNANGLPDNVYRIETVTVGGQKVPFIEITRHFRNNPQDPVLTTKLRGFASVSESGDYSGLMLAAVRLEFKGDNLQNCKLTNPPPTEPQP